ncbi:MAG: microcin C ABC transporter permease YejB [Pseudomonadota bacterium]|uniref:microcin C ABC transporter permease YejB n=1 Tax=Fodinicurvata fenggangensis TaxID=1121830 RepID=UPI00047B24C9|nr:microcin C ABC transporter permease YejB [Fodinicurvata fenggangensis]
MTAYIIRRLFLMVPTLLGIMLINFLVLQFVPGGPIEQVISQVTGAGGGTEAAIERASRSGGEDVISSARSERYGAQGLDPEFIKELEQQFGFDKPAHERFIMMIGNYLVFDFGESFFRNADVAELVIDKMPVSISLGIWTMLITYFVSIPLGIAKAVRDGESFDIWTSGIVIVGFAIPNFLFAILLLVLFAGGSYLDWFPLRGLVSDNWEELSWPMQIVDYFWHLALPILAMVISGFAGLTMLTKNSFLENIHQQYVLTARAKGLTERRVLYGHVFRNAMLIVIAGFPAAFISVFFTGVLLIEVIFSLDGLGLLGFEAVINRDYPIVFGTLYFFTLVGLVLNLVGDVMYTVIDPRIDFESRET